MGDLNTFPVSYKVKGQRIVIIGGGEEALNKARLAIKTTARVVIISPHIETDFSTLPVTVEARWFVPADFDGTALVFVAEHGAHADAAKLAARDRGIPVNVVDVPAECDFYTPSIIDRAPLTVAVSSEGEAPVLARLVRARIEAMLAPEIGRLARLAGSLRGRVEHLLTKPQARRFYEKLVTTPNPDVEALLSAAATDEGRGAVWLVGAGPGSADLLTLRAQRILQEADVIVHDQLVPDAVIEMGRRDAQRISVGKKKGHHSFTQAEINALLIRLAKQGKRVARLKSGDPMMFGRAGEEIAALRKAEIDYHIVPGVSAALAAAADTAMPMTLRKVATGVIFATAHGANSEELDHWAVLAGSGLTLALYMGKSIAAELAENLLSRGMPAALPVGIVVNAGRVDVTTLAGTLANLGTLAEQMPDGPAIIFIGEAVRHGDWALNVAAATPAEWKVA